MSEQRDDDNDVVSVLLKFAAVALVVGLVLGGGTLLGVKVLGLGGGDGGSDTPSGDASPSSLPTVALSDPSASEESESPSAPPTPAGISMNLAPSQASPLEKIRITGTYPGRDGVVLQVQRLEGAAWTQFVDVTVTVENGTFSTYVKTSRTGPSQFRVFDPSGGQASAPQTVTIS